jgi:hypothetical protein
VRSRSVLAALALSGVVVAPAAAVPGADRPSDATAEERVARPADQVVDLGPAEPTWHSSDGVVGQPAPYVAARRALPAQRSATTQRRLGPGVVHTTWTQTDARGPVIAHLLAVDLDRDDIRLDVVNPGKVAAVEDVLTEPADVRATRARWLPSTATSTTSVAPGHRSVSLPPRAGGCSTPARPGGTRGSS